MEEETLFERLARERNITVEERPKGVAICCAGIRIFEYGCIDKKNGGINTYTGVMIPLFFLY